MSSTKARPMNRRASANFAGLDGCRDPSFTHSQAKTGDNRITNAACTENNHEAYSEMSNSPTYTKREANRLIMDQACSHAPQDRDANAKKISNARKPHHSNA